MKFLIAVISIFVVSNGCLQTDIEDCKKQITDEGLQIGFELSNRYLIHGYVDTVYSPEIKEVSFFRLMDCHTGQNIVGRFFCFENENYRFDMPSTTLVNKEKSRVNITHYGVLPYGENWALATVPVYKQTLEYNRDTIYRVSSEWILEAKVISYQQALEVINEYEYLKGRGKDVFTNQEGIDALSLMILKLFACSIGSDDETCRDIFLNLERYFPRSTEGILGDIYWRCYGIHSIIFNNSSTSLSERLSISDLS